MGLMATQRDETKMTRFGDLCKEVVEYIFSLVPLKALTRMKTVSKSWRLFITSFRHSHPPSTASGLVLQLKRLQSFSGENFGESLGDNFQESLFLKLHDFQSPKLCTVHSSAATKFRYLIDSCNGLLLYASENGDVWNYHVSSPILDQCIPLPPAHSVSRPSCVSLAFDPRRKNEFKIDCFFWEEVNLDSDTINSMVFSSESWEWKEKQGRILNSELILKKGFMRGQCFCPIVYSNGRFYLIWSSCLLIFDEDGELFTLFPLPRNSCRENPYHQQLWESEGKLHLCDAVKNGFLIWDFVGERLDPRKLDYESSWKFHQFVALDDFISERTNETKVRVTVGQSIRSCAFNEDLQVLYMHVLPNTIVAYSFETRTFMQVWSYGDLRGGDFYISKIRTFLFRPVNLIDFKKCRRSTDN